MAGSALALMASTGASAALGMVFWIVAARLTHPAEVGRASAEVSAMTLLATLSQLNLVNIYTRFLPRAGIRARRLVVAGYGACFAIGIAVAAGFVAFGGGHAILRPGTASATVFVAAVGLWTIFVLEDSVLTGLHAAKVVPFENALFSAAKLALLVPFATHGSPGIFLAWALPVVPTVAVVNVYVFRRRLPVHSARSGGRSELPEPRKLAGFVLAEYVSSVIGSGSTYLLPVVVIDSLGARSGAYFYIPWIVGVVLHALLWNISTAFVVEAGYHRGDFGSLLRRSVQLTSLLVLPVVVLLLVAAPLLLRVLGTGYAAHGSSLLRLVALATVPTAVTVLFETFLWYEVRLWQFAGVETIRVAVLLGVSFGLLGRLHVVAAGVGLLASEVVVALGALPAVRRRWRALARR